MPDNSEGNRAGVRNREGGNSGGGEGRPECQGKVDVSFGQVLLVISWPGCWQCPFPQTEEVTQQSSSFSLWFEGAGLMPVTSQDSPVFWRLQVMGLMRVS